MTDGTENDHAPWHARWREGRIGFHQADGNPLLKAHLPALGLERGARLFLPLCGKTGDIPWLMDQGYAVAGAELSEIAVEALFAEMALTPEITRTGDLKRYSAPGIDIFAGDMFAMTPAMLGHVTAVYDRASLVALPRDVRARYAPFLVALSGGAPHLLIAFDYDASTVNGPPFPVPEAEIRAIYPEGTQVTALADTDARGGIKGVTPAREQVWHLVPQANGSSG